MLDIATIVAMLALTSGLMCVVLAAGAVSLRSPTIVRATGGLLMLSVALTLMVFRESLTPLFGMALANALVVAGLGMQVAALFTFEGRRAPLWLLYAPGPVAFAILIGLVENYPAFTTVSSIAISGPLFVQCGLLLAWSRRDERNLRLAMATAYFLGALMLLVRAMGVLRGGVAGLYAGDTLTAATLVVLFEALLVGSFGVLVLQRIRREQDFRQLALMDDLTGLFNRRAFFEVAARETARARRARSRLAVLILDADHFRLVNDSHGHAVGDRALQELGAALRGCLRADDVAARYGGEEFVVLCPNATAESALGVAERIRASVANARLAGILPPATVSVGVALFDPAKGESVDAALRHADDAMYEAKRAGRNRVVAHASAAVSAQARVDVVSGL